MATVWEGQCSTPSRLRNDWISIVFRPDLLTYAELEAISRQLAKKTTSGQVREYQWEQVA